MANTAAALEERQLGATLRRDAWWVLPAVTAGLLISFGVYTTWAAFAGDNYRWGPYLSPLYSPLFELDWWPISPAFLILWIPLGFRSTCYYYRKAYYRSFFLDPPACAVGEIQHDYRGETRLFILQNVHRFFLYLALVFLLVLTYDAILAMIWPVNGVTPEGVMAGGPKEFGFGIGTLVLVLNVVLLGGYTLGCHSLRHLVGGGTDCFSCTAFGKTRFKLWQRVSALNAGHMGWAWSSLVWVGFTDLYIRLCAMGVITDMRLF